MKGRKTKGKQTHKHIRTMRRRGQKEKKEKFLGDLVFLERLQTSFNRIERYPSSRTNKKLPTHKMSTLNDQNNSDY